MPPRFYRLVRSFSRPPHPIALSLLAVSFLAAPLLSRVTSTFADNSGLVRPADSTKSDTAWKGRLPIIDLNEDEAIAHALDRLGYGARPGDIERVKRTGLEAWITRQLHPESIPDKTAENRLA